MMAETASKEGIKNTREETSEFEEEEYELNEDEIFDEENVENEEDEKIDEEEEQEEKQVKKRRCEARRRKKLCFGENEEGEEDEEEELEDADEVSAKSFLREESQDYLRLGSYIGASSILSAITFEWDNQKYEFEELCDLGEIENAYRRPFYEIWLGESGRERYLYLCNVLCVPPSLRFLRDIETTTVDLSFREVSSKNFRAMCGALETNAVVKNLLLKSIKLQMEDCYYLGLMLRTNECITVLDLTGCRLGPENIQPLIEHLARNNTLEVLILSKCYIQDEGVKLLSSVILRNNSIYKLDLSYNNIKEEGANALATAFKINKSITDLNLLYNSFYESAAVKGLLRVLGSNPSMSNLNLAWNAINGVDAGVSIANLLRRSRSLTHLDLSDNRLEGLAVLEIKKGLSRARNLEVLKIGKNPIAPEDLDILLAGVKNCASLKVLDLEDLWVNKSFLKILKKIQASRDIIVKYSGVYSNYQIIGPDYPAVILKRAAFEAMKPKKKKQRKDFGHLIWTLGEEPLSDEEFMTKVKKFKAKINKELFPELIKQFTNPKLKQIDVVAMKDKYLSLFPDSKPPPPPKNKKDAAQPAVEETAEGIPTVVADIGIDKVLLYAEEELSEATEILESSLGENVEEVGELIKEAIEDFGEENYEW